MKEKIYVLETIIGVLILIILTLCFNLLSEHMRILPSWFFENLFLGLFTLVGAFLGATIAGKHAVNVMQVQQELIKQEKIEEQNFEFRKYYAKINRGVNSVINRLGYLIKGTSIQVKGLLMNI